jgi:hypothetical protein
MREILPDIFAVDVPDDAKDFGCVHVFQGEDILYYPNEKGETVPIANAPCHCDQVEILFTTKNCSEEHAEMVVDSNWDTELGAMRFGLLSNNSMVHFLPTEALQSLLRSKGLNANKNYLLLRKLTPAISG